MSDTTEETTLDNGEGQDGTGGDEKTLTQEQVNRIAAREASKAREALLKELGVENVDAARSALADHQARVEAEKTAAEKLEEVQAKLKAQDDELNAYRATVQQQLDAAKESLSEAQQKLIPSGSPAEQLAWINAARDVFAAAAPAPAANVNGGATAPANNDQGMTLEQFKELDFAARAEFYAKHPERAAELSHQMRKR